jgi:hypothetical protein
MKRLFVAAWLVLLLIACGGYKPPAIGACGDGTPLAEADCVPGSYIAAKRCFDSKPAACGCLGCDDLRCVSSDSDPAQVTCQAR